MAVQTRINDKPYYIWFNNDGNHNFIGRRLKKAVKYGLNGVLDELEYILKAEKDECNKPFYRDSDYKKLNSKEVKLLMKGAYKEFYEETQIDTGYIYMIEDGKVYVLSVELGEYITI